MIVISRHAHLTSRHMQGGYQEGCRAKVQVLLDLRKSSMNKFRPHFRNHVGHIRILLGNQEVGPFSQEHLLTLILTTLKPQWSNSSLHRVRILCRVNNLLHHHIKLITSVPYLNGLRSHVLREGRERDWESTHLNL